MDFKIVRAGAEHLDALTALTNEFFDYAGLDEQKIAERLASSDFEYYVVVVNNRVVGFVDVEFAQKEDGLQGKILGFAVFNEFRGQGIGEALFDRALLACEERSAQSVVLLVAEDNERAQSFYERKGFRKSGVLDRKLWGKIVLLFVK